MSTLTTVNTVFNDMLHMVKQNGDLIVYLLSSHVWMLLTDWSIVQQWTPAAPGGIVTNRSIKSEKSNEIIGLAIISADKSLVCGGIHNYCLYLSRVGGQEAQHPRWKRVD